MLKDVWLVVYPKSAQNVPSNLKAIAVHHESTEQSEHFFYLEPNPAYMLAGLTHGVVEHGALYPANAHAT